MKPARYVLNLKLVSASLLRLCQAPDNKVFIRNTLLIQQTRELAQFNPSQEKQTKDGGFTDLNLP